MPSIATLVADLSIPGAIAGVGAKPRPEEYNFKSVISQDRAIKYYFKNVDVMLSADVPPILRCVSTETGQAFNGGYVHFEDGWSTVGIMNNSRKIIASSNFSGCEYRIYRSEPGTFLCAHISRPAGAAANTVTAKMTAHATQRGWNLVEQVQTAGLVGQGLCNGVYIVSQLIGTRIRTIRLQYSTTGLIVGRDAWTKDI